MFLDEQISFAAIPDIIEEALSIRTPIGNCSVEEILMEDLKTREWIAERFGPTRAEHHSDSVEREVIR